MADRKITLGIDQEKKDLNEGVVLTIVELDEIINNLSMTNTEIRDYIRRLAFNQKKILKRLVKIS